MLAFTEPAVGNTTHAKLLESLSTLTDVAGILATMGVVTVLLAILKRNAERRCWRKFKNLTRIWLETVRETGNRHPSEFSLDQWTSECERLLTDAKFSPSETVRFLDTSVIVARGIASDLFFMS